MLTSLDGLCEFIFKNQFFLFKLPMTGKHFKLDYTIVSGVRKVLTHFQTNIVVDSEMMIIPNKGLKNTWSKFG